MENIKIYDEKFGDLIKKGVQTVNLDEVNNEVADENTPNEVKKDEWISNSSSNLTCSYCRVEFADVQQQREHYKLDWHRYNLKQQLLSKEPISEELFNEKTDDLSSISGSDTENEDSLDYIATQQGKLFLKGLNGRVFSLHRCLLFEKKANTIEDDVLLWRLKEIRRNNLWTILMLGGGHFAGAVFRGGEPILHKTFHCYTVRAGQGGSQGSRDNKSGGTQPKSAGASLRRYNEQALVQHVKEILSAWKDEIAKSDLIIYRAAGPYNKAVLFGGKPAVLDRNDTRLRTVPFCTRRATFAEVKRVHSLLTDVQTFASLDEAHRRFAQQTSPDRDTKRPKMKSSSINRAKSREITQRPLPGELSSTESEKGDENTDFSMNDTEISFKDTLQTFDDSLSPEERKNSKPKKKPRKSKSKKLKEQEEKRKNELRNAIKEGNVTYVKSMLKTLQDDSEMRRFMAEPLDEDGNTILHLAALHNQNTLIESLLEDSFDVCLKNKKQQTPYVVTQSKETREVFRAFAQNHPDKHNYNKANIPVVTATPEEIAEKRRQQRKVKREKEKAKKKESEVRAVEQAERERFLKLSDREKRALAAERRILSKDGTVTARCFLCAVDISGKVPFEYAGNRFCTVDCLKAHRVQNPIKLS